MNDVAGVSDSFRAIVERNGKVISDTAVIGVFGTIKKYLRRIWRLRVIAISTNPNKSVTILVRGNIIFIKENQNVPNR